ncbi:MAG: SDR family oxidoreductase [Gemmatimonadota bacterium]
MVSEVTEVTGETRALAQKVVFVTGASSGIGRAIALAAARNGADLAISYRRNRDGVETLADEIRRLGRRVEVTALDLAEPAAIAGLPTWLQQRFGGCDVWINSAGADILTGEGARLSREEKLERLLAVDLRGTMLASWAAVELMRSQPAGGVIINMSWDHVIRGMEGENPSLFSAAKGGVLSFSKSLARSVAPHVRVNILGPGWIETAFGEGADARFRQKVAESIPLRRWGTPEDVASAAVYLASDAASYLTGQMIMINGGDVM